MSGRGWWRVGRAAFLGLVIVGASSGVALTASQAGVRTAEAIVAQSKAKDDNKSGSKKNQGSDSDPDHVLNAQVLEIDTLKDPPEMVVGSVDGQTVVRVLKTDEIAINGVGIGDYVELNGEKINEQLFEATQISVSERFKDTSSNNDNKSKKH